MLVQDLEGPQAGRFIGEFGNFSVLESALSDTVYGLSPTNVNVFFQNHTNRVSTASHPRHRDPPKIRSHFLVTAHGQPELDDVLLQLEYVSLTALDWQLKRNMATLGVPTAYDVVVLAVSRLTQVDDPDAVIAEFGMEEPPPDNTKSSNMAQRSAKLCVPLWWLLGWLVFPRTLQHLLQ